MGTNFYVNDGTTAADRTHVGKRSSAGLYCWDCRLTLCRGGERMIHMGGAYIMTLPSKRWKEARAMEWFDACPRCGSHPAPEGLDASSAGRELGFNASRPEGKRGVASCASWTWAMEPGAIEGVNEFVDEYGHVYNATEFAEVLEECPVRYGDMIGREFS